MASLQTKFAVGLFVAIGLGLIIVVVIWLGMSNYFKQGRRFVAYFDESVQGLGKDSPVKYRGVDIGRVENISVAPDADLIQVLMSIESDLSAAQLQNEMVAMLKSVGITGIMFVELERQTPGKPAPGPELDFESRYPVVPTKSSDIKRIIGDLETALGKIVAVDVQGIAAQINQTLSSIRQAVEAAGIEQVSTNVNATLDSAHRAFDPGKWSDVLDSFKAAADQFQGMSTDARQTIGAAEQTVRHFNRLLENNRQTVEAAVQALHEAMDATATVAKDGRVLVQSTDDRLAQMQLRLTETLDRLEETAVYVNRLLDVLSQQPSQLFFGQPPVGLKDTDRDTR